MFSILFSLKYNPYFWGCKIAKLTEYCQTDRVVKYISAWLVSTLLWLDHHISYSVCWWSVTFHINNIFTFSKLRIALRENSMENIKDGICQTLKSSKHFITLISMLRTLYFVYIFTPQKSVKKKCTFLCIFSWF